MNRRARQQKQRERESYRGHVLYSLAAPSRNDPMKSKKGTEEFDRGLIVAQFVGGAALVLAVLAFLHRQDAQRRVGELVGRGEVRDAAIDSRDGGESTTTETKHRRPNRPCTHL